MQFKAADRYLLTEILNEMTSLISFINVLIETLLRFRIFYSSEMYFALKYKSFVFGFAICKYGWLTNCEF